MYNIVKVEIKRTHPLYEYCSNVCHASNNLYNSVLYRMRQTMTGISKDSSELTTNEKEVLNELQDFVDHNPSFEMPTEKKWFLSYNFLNALMYYTQNTDFYNNDLSKQTAQQIVKKVVKTMKSFCRSCKAFKHNPCNFTGIPKLPNYKKPGGMSTVYFTNQDCVVKEQDNIFFVKFPYTEEVCQIKKTQGRLKSVTLKPYFDVFYFSFVFETPNVFIPMEQDEHNERVIFAQPKRCIAIDFGVDNLAAISNNFNQKGLLIKGGIVKSKNQWFNKINAQMQSLKDKGVSLDMYKNNWIYRNNFMTDIMHKYADYIIKYCISNNVDTIILGSTKGWKQSSKMDNKNNQTFVGIPFDMLKRYITYRAIRNGINIIYQEESYTSKASFKHKDNIPVYGQTDNTNYNFSGKRIKRSLYRNKDGSVVNADLNAAANIGRKALPDLFVSVNFDKPEILKNIFNM